MEKVVIIGANEFQNPLIIKAKEMGYETHVFAWRDGAIGEKTADFFYPISIVEKEQILEECRKIQPSAVVTIASDLAGITVNYVARNLGLVCNSERNIVISTNKYQMRTALLEAGIPTPRFVKVHKGETDPDLYDFEYPIIVKPTDRSGSRGITKLLDKGDLEKAIEDAVSNSFDEEAIIEEYIEGEEFSCECISFEGTHNFLAVTRKYTSGAPHFIETGHLQPSGLSDEILNKVKNHIYQSLDALEIRYGASHSEFKVTPQGEIRIIEIGARMGGDCIGSDLVRISTGYDFVKMTLQVALGERPEMIKYADGRYAAIKFIFSKEDLEHLELLKKEKGKVIKYISSIDMGEGEIVDSSTRYGYYILSCKSEKEAIELAQLK